MIGSLRQPGDTNILHSLCLNVSIGEQMPKYYLHGIPVDESSLELN
jgi:hypothetical protein